MVNSHYTVRINVTEPCVLRVFLRPPPRQLKYYAAKMNSVCLVTVVNDVSVGLNIISPRCIKI